MYKVLVVEDDQTIQVGLKKAFEKEGMEVVQAFDGEDGVYLAKTESPDLIILDVMMPFMNGFEVVTELRGSCDEVPIIMLSARTETQDKVRGIKLGADDYLEKPFSIDELMARVHRKLKSKTTKLILFSECSYDLTTNILFKKNKKIDLTGKEIKILKFLISRKNQVVTREMIIQSVWGGDYFGTDRTVDNFILGLRKKIGKESLVTLRGLGYRFVTK